MNKIKYYIEAYKNLKVENIETVVKQLEEIKYELEQIYYEAVSDKELSDYRLYLLNRKRTLLTELSVNKVEEYAKFVNDVSKISKIFGVLLITLLLSLTAIMFATGINLIILVFILSRIFDYKISSVKTCLNETKDTVKELTLEIKPIHRNCITFLDKKVCDNTIKKIDIIAEKADDPEVSIHLNASKMIKEWLALGFDKRKEYPAPELECATKILQFELGTEEDDLEKLILLAKEEISKENLLSRVYRVREKKE